MPEQYVVIGNGIAGVTAAEILRNEDADAEITVIADDPFPVYYRPALKDYLAGRVHEDKLWARSTSFYQDLRIRFLSERVIGIQAGQHLVQLQSGRQCGYHRLLLACGARACRLRCPGSDLAGVATLRTVADYQAVQERLRCIRRIVVSGSGTLALETIETLRHRGFQVTHLVRKRALWSEVLDLAASDLVLQQERRDGVDVRVEEEIAEVTGKNGQVSGVITTSGARIACELVLVAIGVEPITNFIKSSGIPCGHGVSVDPAMRTAAPDIYAAGDVLEISDPQTSRKRVIGQWYPAVQQARAAAYSMLDLLDTEHPFSASTFYNATLLYGLDFASVGLTQTPKGAQDYQEIVADPQPRAYRKILLKDGVPVGTLALGERKGVLTLKRAIDHKVNLTPVLGKLFVDDFKLNEWLDQQGVPPPTLNVSREGAAVVRQVAGTAVQEIVAISEQRGKAFLLPDATSPEAQQAGLRPEKILLSQTRVMTIGRQPGIILLIDHASVSRRHAEISYIDGHYILRDMSSSNGTFVNTTRLTTGSAHLLLPGDQLRFGRVNYVFQVEQPAKPAKQQLSTEDAERTRLVPHVTGFYEPAAKQLSASSTQPLLTADGSLLLPGAQEAISASVAATFQTSPVLIAILQERSRIFYLKPGKTLMVGRDKQSAIVLPDMSASRKHAEVFYGSDGFYVRDLDSTNGVKVNSTWIDNPYRLAHGDRILIGGITLYFLYQLTEEEPPPPAASDDAQASFVCSTCETPTHEHARFCAHCGAPLEQSVLTRA